MKTFTLPTLLLAAALGVAPALHAERTPDSVILSSHSFLDAHPDIKYRNLGFAAQGRGDAAAAHAAFERAARFADKPSQAVIAEMLWKGEGVAQDRAKAYAWMDLAAERGYRSLLVQREAYWKALAPAEQEAAVSFGEGLYAEYGDSVAQPRLESRLRQARKKSAGSRTGYVSNLRINVTTPGGEFTVDGSSYYNPDYWDPKKYWAWQARSFNGSPRPRVEVGDMSSAQVEAN
jgi:hypothetical protein